MKYLFIPMLLAAVVACDDHSLSGEGDGPERLSGKWIMFERGYSPGAGYIVEPVDDKPPLTVSFLASHVVRSNIPELEAFSFYRIFDDLHQGGKIVAFYRHDPGDRATLESAAAAYNISEVEGTIRLDYRFCFEGCHIGLRKFE